MVNKKYDVIVIGSGPGGEGAAMKSRKEGKKVAVVDESLMVGGSCTHKGTIPSKALRHAVSHMADSSNFRNYSFQDMLKSAEQVIEKQVRMRRGFYDRNYVDVITGRAKFVSENTLEVETPNDGTEKYEAKKFVIATGARPYHPENIDFTHSRILDSDTVLNIKDHPMKVIIYGAGVIGCEYASILRRMNIKINIINSYEKLLSFLDDEIIDALSYHLRENGITIRHNETYEKIEADDEKATVYLQSNKQITADYVLFTQGRTGNSNNMGLEEIGIEIDGRGYIKVNEFYQTALRHIYAVGDVVGYPSLASAAYDQGRFAGKHLVSGTCTNRLVEHIPTGIYTIPEISSVGYTEKELTEKAIPYEVGQSFFKHLARAQITGNTEGMLKILFHRETLEILGIHCFGAYAAEIIHIGQVVMSQKGEANHLEYFTSTTFNYPTMAEAYRVAALNGLNRLK